MTTVQRDLADRIERMLARLERDPAAEPTFGELAEAAAFERPSVPLTMGQMVAFSGVGEHTLRYYEREGLVRVPRDAAGRRRYDAAAVERIVLVSRLRVSNMPIATLRDLARALDAVDANGADGAGTADRPDPVAAADELHALLERHRDELRRRIAELRLALAITEFKMAARRVSTTATTRPT